MSDSPFKSLPTRDPKAGLPLLMLELHREATLGEAIHEARRLADRLELAVGMHFQGFPLITYPMESTEAVLHRYNATRQQIQEAAQTQALRQSLTGRREN
jgi:hypothetical protein